MHPSPIPFIASLCSYALTAEVSATPKPGLVDRHDNGAHLDMCFDTFLESTRAITPWIAAMAQMGFEWPQHRSLSGLFPAIRPLGIQAEQAMYQATGGVNTHKGIIFSMGLTVAAAGVSVRRLGCFQAEPILRLTGELCYDSMEQDFQKMAAAGPVTHGEALYTRFRQKGIRGEAQMGFPSVREVSLPALRRFSKEAKSPNDAHINTLLTLMAQVDDTNILSRGGYEQLDYVKKESSRILGLGGAMTREGMDALNEANKNFIRRNLSSGGCADLLALTIFLYHLEQQDDAVHGQTA